MTMPNERTRAVLWAGGFLIELARDTTLPLRIRQQAVVIARHFLTVEDVESLSTNGRSLFSGSKFASPSQVPMGPDDYKFGPLRYSTRLKWPTEEDARHGPKPRNTRS